MDPSASKLSPNLKSSLLTNATLALPPAPTPANMKKKSLTPPPFPNSKSRQTKKVKSIAKHENPAHIKGRTRRFLQTLCPNTHFCTSLHLYPAQLRAYFDHFSGKYLSSPIRRIGTTSASGFVYELWYQNDGYKAAAILKTSRKKHGHPLLYEAYIGEKYVNELASQFLCFIQTQRCYIHTDRALYNLMAGGNDVDKKKLVNALDPFPSYSAPNIVRYSCDHPDKIAVQLEYIHGAMNLESLLLKKQLNDGELAAILYQIYKPLSVLKDVFTHYDLHCQNIMLYKIPGNQWMQLVYCETPDADKTAVREKRITCSLLTQYVVKIIDYGQSFTPVSQLFADSLTDDCKYNMMFDPSLTSRNNWSSCLLPNPSHDLRAASIVNDILTLKYRQLRFVTKSPLAMLLERVHYISDYGTPAVEHGQFNPAIGPIKNVMDMAAALEYLFAAHPDLTCLNMNPIPVCTITTELNLDLKTPVHIHFHDIKEIKGKASAVTPEIRPSTDPIQLSIDYQKIKDRHGPTTPQMLRSTFSWLYEAAKQLNATIDQFVLACYIWMDILQNETVEKSRMRLEMSAAAIIAGIYLYGPIQERFATYESIAGGVFTTNELEQKVEDRKNLYDMVDFVIQESHQSLMRSKKRLTDENKPEIIASLEGKLRLPFEPTLRELRFDMKV